MSDPGRPSDPFGRSDRTIIRPNPGGRRPDAPAQPAAPYPPAAPFPPPAAPAPQPYPSAPPPPPRRSDDVWATGAAPTAGWVTPSAAPPLPVAPPLAPGVPAFRRDVPTTANRNPILQAAAPLLLLIGRLRLAPPAQAAFAPLMDEVARAIDGFEREAVHAGVTPQQAQVAKYVLSATADDIVQNLPVEDRHLWTQYSMLSRFFGERTGGVRFFEELDRARLDPLGNYGLLELFHACLALGFQGVHRTSAGGAAMLQQIQRNLYEVLRQVRPAEPELSPRWQGQDIGRRRTAFRVPPWSVAAVAAVLLMVVFVALRMLLSGSAESAAAALLAMNPSADIGIQRRVFVPPPPPPPPPPPTSQILRIRQVLAPEIAARKVTVTDNPTSIVVRIPNGLLFGPGNATVRPDFIPLAKRIAAGVEVEPGTIMVVGHSDSTPIHTVRFPSNFELSLARAKAVAALIRPGLSQPDRLKVEGRGADQPIASNKTAAGRAENRRVEILIPRS
ncbi:MAG TPA: type VI secretion system protein TssL, long form [Hyphomicrobiales bacterium]|nr:type VI secretion system protein TssL, long form [Hyphomicrobiales bacterium]